MKIYQIYLELVEKKKKKKPAPCDNIRMKQKH